MLQQPMFWGEWWLVRNPRSEVWESFTTDEKDPTKITHPVPHLAYWSRGEAARWRAKFVERPLRPRRRTHQHRLLGALACKQCGRLLIRGGATIRDGRVLEWIPRYATPSSPPSGAGTSRASNKQSSGC